MLKKYVSFVQLLFAYIYLCVYALIRADMCMRSVLAYYHRLYIHIYIIDGMYERGV